MPTYEYSCKECGQHLEVVQSFKDDTLSECPHCSGHLRKVFSPIGISFKGQGFYKTDNRSGAKAGSKSEKSESTTKSETKGETSSSSSSDSGSKAESGSSTTSKAEAKSA
jgi:putative FmdB family regulatory protein